MGIRTHSQLANERGGRDNACVHERRADLGATTRLSELALSRAVISCSSVYLKLWTTRRESEAPSVNIFELLTVVGVIVAGYICGKHFGFHFGVGGWIGGFALGSLLAVAGYCIFRRLIGVTGKK